MVPYTFIECKQSKGCMAGAGGFESRAMLQDNDLPLLANNPAYVKYINVPRCEEGMDKKFRKQAVRGNLTSC